MSLLLPIPLFSAHPPSPARKPTLLKPSLCGSSPAPVPLPSPAPAQGPETDAAATAPLSGGCEACGREEVERGCDGEGRIQGGIATVPGFGWWPIKAYRPCPGFVASGGRYRRRGQSMDEVASGGRRPAPKVVATTEAQSREK